MKPITKLLTVFSLVSAASVQAAFGQMTRTFDFFDEWGNGYSKPQGPGPFPRIVTDLPGVMAQDPYSGLVTLCYTLNPVPVPVPSPAGAPGDVLIYEDDQHTHLSDILRFDGQGHLYFFSQMDPGELNPAPADVTQLPNPLTQVGIVALTETAVDGGIGALYNPGYGEPGSSSGIFGDMSEMYYEFMSDVPEPGVDALALLGSGCLLLLKRRGCADRAWAVSG